MKIVRKSKPDRPLKLEGDTVAADEELLNQWYDRLSYRDRLHHKPNQRDRSTPLDTQVARILKTVRERHLWLACECQTNDRSADRTSYLPSHAPILCPVQLDTWGRRYSFRRIRPTNPHHPTCIFHAPTRLADRFSFERSEADAERPSPGVSPNTTTSGTSPPLASMQPLSRRTSFAIDLREPRELTLAMASSASTVDGVPYRSRAKSRPKLARMLFTLLEEAQLHIVRPGWWRQRNLGWQQLHTLERTRRYIVNRIPLKHYLTTQPTAIAQGCRQLETLACQERNDWPPHVQPQAFFAGIATAVDRERRSIQPLGQAEVSIVEDEPVCFVPPGGRATGPFWVFAHVGASRVQPGTYCLRQAYVHPVFSTVLLVPVDSHAERQTLDILLAAQRLLYTQGYAIAIAKPLHDFRTEAGEPYRPDFVLYPHQRGRGLQPGACIVVETMGFTDSDYVERKAKTHQRMRELGDVLAWDICGDLSDACKQALRDEAVRACKSLMQPRALSTKS
ncbi:MAG: hypothetical protein AAGM36_03345 [Cyanobacteria bacterium J06597_1]